MPIAFDIPMLINIAAILVMFYCLYSVLSVGSNMAGGAVVYRRLFGNSVLQPGSARISTHFGFAYFLLRRYLCVDYYSYGASHY
jgi:hypothetical protein